LVTTRQIGLALPAITPIPIYTSPIQRRRLDVTVALALRRSDPGGKRNAAEREDRGRESDEHQEYAALGQHAQKDTAYPRVTPR
jgi:hypothetical protein